MVGKLWSIQFQKRPIIKVAYLSHGVSKMSDLFMSKLHLTCTFMVHNQISSKMVDAKGQFSSVLMKIQGQNGPTRELLEILECEFLQHITYAK